jgi:hypothetical protein
MGIGGRRPKPPGQARTRNPRVYDWVEVEDVPNTAGPRLPARRCNGQRWPAHVRDRWKAWRAMPHARLWRPSDWSFALDTLELVARAADGDAPVSLLTEIRARERVMGCTWDARLAQRIRYVAPKTDDGSPEPVVSLDSYRDL